MHICTEESAMAKDNYANYSADLVLDERGSIRIADDVIATIAGLAATEVEGVASMSGNMTNEIVAKFGVKNLTKGVVVEVADKMVNVKLNLALRYGYSIPKTTAEVQERVQNAIENMTELTVSCVDIRIAGIELDKK